MPHWKLCAGHDFQDLCQQYFYREKNYPHTDIFSVMMHIPYPVYFLYDLALSQNDPFDESYCNNNYDIDHFLCSMYSRIFMYHAVKHEQRHYDID